MTGRVVKYQLIAFIVIAVVGIVFVGAKYVRLDNLLGFGQYEVDAKFPHGSGIYPDAEVTYRGVSVGRVGGMSLTEDGVSVTLLINSDAPDIPASTRAVIADRSAIGEQYVDLLPENSDGPYLHDGSVIEQTPDSTPVPVEDLLASVDRFAQSVPLTDLTTVVDELGTAFGGKGDDLQVLVDSLNDFTESAHEALPSITALIRDGRTVLDTQSDQADAVRTFSDGLEKLTMQLQASDPDVRRLIGTGLYASDQAGALLAESGPALTEDLTNLRELVETLAPTTFALRPLLQLLPTLSIGASATAPGDGTTHFGLVLETNNPPACTRGYEGTYAILEQMKAQNPNFDDTVDEFPFNKDATCTVPQGNPTAVRGAERAQFADPSIVQPWDSNPKTDPDKLNLTPIAVQLATLMGITPKR
ncbi:MCE family protein [Antrihabitans sp. YC2-6]|uniref:MCE family protein n=1 Tax=Antrihabitans sp. YC2-6 TaxID=2799498 RepID=UPI0018F4FFB2|nr:MlaD family protein [Antrihabitans sp. YC2-6]MBJ8347953.1 MCE family protein [Antrihabitans sp. YC2-6]